MDKKNYDNVKLPEKVFLNGDEYKGDVGFINGYNGYFKTDDDSLLCAVINNSCFTPNNLPNGTPNYLKDENGKFIHSENRRGQLLTI